MDNYEENLRQNLADPTSHDELVEDIEYVLDLQGGADRHIIVISPNDPSLIGKTLAEVAAAHDRTPVEQLVEFAFNGTPQVRSGVRFRPVAGHAFDVDNYMRQTYTATSTDAGVVLQTRAGQHPRYFVCAECSLRVQSASTSFPDYWNRRPRGMLDALRGGARKKTAIAHPSNGRPRGLR